MPIEYHFKRDDCPSFGGASLSGPREDCLLRVFDIISEDPERLVNSKFLEGGVERDGGDFRSLMAILKKFGFTNLSEERGSSIKAENFFTNSGLAYVKVLHALASNDEPISEDAKSYLLQAKKHILQDAIWRCFRCIEEVRFTGIRIILSIIGVSKTMSFNEYCFALSEKIVDPDSNFKDIGQHIISNRSIPVEYKYDKVVQPSGKPETTTTSFDTILQTTKETLTQAGIIKVEDGLMKVDDIDFFKHHKLPYNE